MSGWQPAAYKDYQWIVADPDLLGRKLAIRGTRLSVSLILECLANGMPSTISTRHTMIASLQKLFRKC